MTKPVIIVGAGIGGLMAAAELAVSRIPVVVLEAQAGPGGKMHREHVGEWPIDVGPTVLTLKPIFDELFERAGLSFEQAVPLKKQSRLARHFWPDGTTLDLFADLGASADAIAQAFGSEAAAGYRSYAAYAEKLYDTAQEPFIYAPRPTLAKAMWHFGRKVFTAAKDMDAGRTMDDALRVFFPHTPKLRQLFGRYATYTGASPHLAPATLHLISHVERMGVWTVVGGLSHLAEALAKLIVDHGGALQYRTQVSGVRTHRGRVRGVTLADGSTLEADHVVLNADIRAIEADALWPGAGSAAAVRLGRLTSKEPAGLSAVVMAMVGQVTGQPLAGHNVFFSGEPAHKEFSSLFERRRMVPNPTLYVYASDRAENDGGVLAGQERLMGLINAPAGMAPLETDEIAQWQQVMLKRMAQNDVRVHLTHTPLCRQPADFAARFPGSRGALYGRPPHSWRGFFTRSGSRGSAAGLYLTGGGVHPGAGVPMAAMSGRLAAVALMQDAHLTRPSPPAATPGGTWTDRATTAATL